jgi:protein-export membrane protein SecD/preprotein translocase SecF subunit
VRGTRRFVTSIVLVALVVVGLVATIVMLGYKPKLGLDLQGGLSVVLTAPPHTSSAKLEEALNILRNRIDRAGVGEPQISREGSDNVLIELPGVKDPQSLLKLIGQTAQLQFRQVKGVITPSSPGFATATVSTTDDPNQVVTYTGSDGAKYVLDKATLTGSGIQSASAVIDNQGVWHVNLSFKSDAAKTWQDFTGRLACLPAGTPSRQIGIVLDQVVQSAPQVSTNVQCNVGINTGSTDITGAFTQKQAKDLALVLNTGALPVKLTQSQVQTISPTLGKQSLRAGLTAGVIGLALVMLYVAVYYRALGLQTWVGLIVFSTLIYCLVIVLGNTIGFSLTLAGIAGLIVAIGITTDSYVVFFERVKEEVHQGRTLRSSIDRGFHNALRTLFTADSVTFFAALILFILAVGSVRGFALTLGMATALDVGLFLALTYPLAAILARSHLFSEGRFIGMREALEGRKQKGLARKIYRSEFDIDFIGRRKLWLAISGTLVAISLLALIPGIRGLKYSIDFRGGSLYQVPLSKAVSVPDISSALGKAGISAAQIQIATDPSGKKTAQVQTEANVDQAKAEDALATVAGTTPNQISIQTVGTKWGSQITSKAVRGLIVFLVVVILYMAWRLETKMSGAGIVALLHDMAITAGVYAITGLEVSPATVIGILTILGYSLYDTVVVFDKIKEQVALPSNAKKPYGQIANESMNLVLMRSINTSLTTLLPVGSLLFVGSFLLGADTLRTLALALFVGIAAGTYSSIFVATPLLSILKEKEPRYASLRAARIARQPALATGGGGTIGRSVAAEPKVQPKPSPNRPPPPKRSVVQGRAQPEASDPDGDGKASVEESPNGETGAESPAPNGKGPGKPAGPPPGGRVQPRRTNRSRRKKGRR